MASYAALAELKVAMGISDTSDDGPLQLALDSATMLIDEHCNRTFAAAETAIARYFTASGHGRVEVDDIYTTTGLVVSSANTAVAAEVLYVSTGYQLGPVNALAKGKPYTYIRHTASGFSTAEGAIAVTARWGYAATVPKPVQQACLLQANRIFSRRHSPFGVTGSPDMGGELRLLAKVDPDVAVLLRPFVRMWAG